MQLERHHAGIIADLGFPSPQSVAGRLSIASLYPNQRKRTGLYLLILEGGTFYIGLAKDVVRRFGAHRQRLGNRILGISFQRSSSRALAQRELALIEQAERAGLPLEQTVGKSHVLGDADLDSVIPLADFERWLAAPSRPIGAVGNLEQEPQVEQGRAARDRHALRELERHDLGEQVQGLLLAYVGCCVPYPERTVGEFWTVSCMPSTGSGPWRRLCCVSAHWMETLVAGTARREPDVLNGFVVVAASVLEAHFGSLESTERQLDVQISTDRPYRSAGYDQCRIDVYSAEHGSVLLHEAVVQRAAGLLLYRVMRKGPSQYSPYHCTALGQKVVSSLSVGAA